ncbi:hypothetical protein [Microbacterium sp. UCD-TDU]|uniref:hypothetical protein n=1 Tax=Microbacterium TaxID=33882 RepID=UPI0003696ADB|nr:hypothetical protein [Microbacterium sp. UCD-TDU]EYT61615.1 hypothetical protein D514_0101800 [Microbacterium sp. UCD-TDU]
MRRAYDLRGGGIPDKIADDGQARSELCLQICHELLALSDPCASDLWIWPSHFSDRIQHGLPYLIPLPEPLSQLS